MNKTVSIDVLATPPGNIDLANMMIGQVVEPQTRWTPGALTNSILDVSGVPLAILVASTSLAVFDVSGTVGSEVSDAFLAAARAATGSEYDALFTTAEGTTKAKVIECNQMTYPSLGLVVGDSNADDIPYGHPIFQVFKPKLPTFTIATLVNNIETALIGNGDNYLLLVDQVSESVTVVLFASAANAAAAFAGFVATPFGLGSINPVVASFSTTFEAPTAGTPGFGWE